MKKPKPIECDFTLGHVQCPARLYRDGGGYANCIYVVGHQSKHKTFSKVTWDQNIEGQYNLVSYGPFYQLEWPE